MWRYKVIGVNLDRFAWFWKGSAKSPIVIRAANRGRARIIGNGGFQIVGCGYVVVGGFSLFHKDVDMACQMTGSNHCRFTRNHVRNREIIASERLDRRLHWAAISGENSHHNRIDHNLFEKKHNSGVMVCAGRSDTEAGNTATHYVRIDHNHFRDFRSGIGNGRRILDDLARLNQLQPMTDNQVGFIGLDNCFFHSS